MKRKLSRLEYALLIVPLLAMVALSMRQHLSTTWNRVFVSGLPYQGDLVDFKFSPDGRQLVVSSYNRKTSATQLQWIDVQSQRVTANIEGAGGGTINWSPDGKLFAFVAGNRFAIWDAVNHVRVWRTSIPSATYLQYDAWSSNTILKMSSSTIQGRTLLSRTTYQFDVRSKTLRNLGTKPFLASSSTRYPDEPSHLSPDGRWKISLSDSIAVPLTKFPSTSTWRPSFSIGRRILLWNRTTGKLERSFEGDMFNDVAFLDNDTIVSVARLTSSTGMGSSPGTALPPMTYVSTMTMKSTHSVWQTLDSEEQSLGFSPDRRFLVTRLPDKLRFRDARTVRVVSDQDLKVPFINRNEFSSDSRFLAYSYSDSSIAKPNDSGNIFIVPLPSNEANTAQKP
jgi:dipeptidyl aminopeptidase/acylaminoacyl peptidase